MNLPEYQKKLEAYEALTEVSEIPIRHAEHADTGSFENALIVTVSADLQAYLIEYITDHQTEILSEIKESVRIQLEADKIQALAENEVQVAAIKNSSL